VDAEGADLELRDPTDRLPQGARAARGLRRGQLCHTEGQRFLYERLKSLGYPATFEALPDSTHEILSDAAVQMLGDAIPQKL
jgi:hypothetical protein